MAKRKSSRIYGAFPGAPGEPPRKQTGHLRRSITYEVDRPNLVVRIGTSLNYGRFLEMGTRHLKPRPWLRRSLAECQAQIRRILATRMG